ncbi:MAG: NADAR family protein [Acidobacteriota bacterium]
MTGARLYSREALQEACNRGLDLEFLFFWGHTPKADAEVGPWVFSQWFPTPFDVDGVSYPTAEHFMMAEKARLFDDPAMLDAILDADSPRDAKAFGRKVAGFDQETWKAHRFEIVTRGSVAKFSGTPELRDYLLGTGDWVLVEASPRDIIWGIGYGASNPKALDPNQWRGRNLLGFALMKARDELAAAAP